MPLKQNIAEWLRKTGLLGLFDRLRYTAQNIRYGKANRDFIRKNSSVKFPPSYFIYETYRLDYAAYYNDGHATAAELTELFKKYTPLSANARVLDWGCGPARIVRHFPLLLPGCDIYATDYNPVYIDWCRQHIPGIHFDTNQIEPPLVYPNDSFSAVSGLSIFTHLSINLHEGWFRELHRVIKPGGILIITTQGDAYRHKLLEKEKELFDKGQIVVREKFKLGHRLYSAFQPKEAIIALATGKFNVITCFEADKTGGQDMWVLNKI